MEAILKDCLTTLRMARNALDQWDKDRHAQVFLKMR